MIVKLCDEFPDGQTRLICFGLMNLCHYKSQEKPEQLRTGSWYDLKIQLDAIGYKMLHGHKLVINLTCAYWPMIWTPRRCTNMSLRNGHLSLPIVQNLNIASQPFNEEPKYGPSLEIEQKEQSSYERQLIFGLSNKTKMIQITDKDGYRIHKDSDIGLGEVTQSCYELTGLQDPTSAKVTITHDLNLDYDVTSGQPFKSRIMTESQMTCDLDNFYLKEHLKVIIDDTETFFEKTWNETVPRIFS